MLSKETQTAICFNGIPTFGIHGPRLKDKISKKTGTRKDISTIPGDRKHLSRMMTSDSYSETRQLTMSFWPPWTNLCNASLPSGTRCEPICWSRHWNIESPRLPSYEGPWHKWFMQSLVISQFETRTKLWNSWFLGVRETWICIFEMKRWCKTIAWRLSTPLAYNYLILCCQWMTRGQHTCFRTHWVKAQLSVLIVSKPDAPFHPPLLPPWNQKKQQHDYGLCLGGMGARVLAAVLFLLCGWCWFCYIVSAQRGLPWRRAMIPGSSGIRLSSLC